MLDVRARTMKSLCVYLVECVRDQLIIGILEIYVTASVPTDWTRGECVGFTRYQGEGMASQLQ
jgi:hypothetical protein